MNIGLGWKGRAAGLWCVLLALSCSTDESKKVLGATCARSEDCESGRCDELVCKSASPAGPGEICSHPLECASERCVEGRCATQGPDGGLPEASVGDGGGADSIGDASVDSGIADGMAPPGDATPFVPNWQPGAVVSQAGWAWHHPLPHNHALNAIWGLSATRLYAVGAGGAALRFDGSAWARLGAPPPTSLSGIWGSSEHALWAVGAEGTILRFDGTNWTSAPSPVNADLSTVWGSAADDVWAAGRGGTIVHFDGSQWSEVSSPITASMTQIWGVSSSAIWAASGGTDLLHYDGTGWSVQVVPAIAGLRAIHGSAADNVWAVGASGAVVRYDGSSWKAIPFPWPQASLSSVWTAGPSRVWLAGQAQFFHFDGKDWAVSAVSPAQQHYMLWGSAPSDVWAFEASLPVPSAPYRTYHYDGRKWEAASQSLTDQTLRAVFARAPDDVWAVGDEALMHFDGSRWQVAAPPVTSSVQDVWSGTRGAAWAVGSGGVILRFEAGSWRSVVSPTDRDLAKVWGASASRIWAVGSANELEGRATLLHYDGTQWRSEMDLPQAGAMKLEVVWGTAATAVWTMGLDERGDTLRWFYDGSSWSDQSPHRESTGEHMALGGSSATDIWVSRAFLSIVGSSLTLQHGTGQPLSWVDVAPPEPWFLVSGFFGMGPNELWASGYVYDPWGFYFGGTVHRYDGTQWTAMGPSDVVTPNAISGTATGGIWVVGEKAQILHHP